MLLNEIIEKDKRNESLTHQIIALQERSQVEQSNYAATLKRLKQNEPIEAQGSIDSLDDACNRLVNSKDDIIASLGMRLENRDSANTALINMVQLQTEQLSNDSAIYVANIKYLQDENTKVSKGLRRSKVAVKVLAWSIGAYAVLVSINALID